MISVTNLSMRYGDQILFGEISLQFGGGQRYGVVGANGSGKSTLMRILIGEEEPSGGSINLPSKLRLGYLKQDQHHYDQSAILDTVLMGRDRLWQAMADKHQLLEQTGEFSDEDGYKLSTLEEVILAEDGYAAEAEAAKILAGLGIPEIKHRDLVRTLSGGYKLRVLLAKLLFSKPEMMLLDEPTNHLDIISIRWLEEYLRDVDATTMVVSHDQSFLNRVCTQIVDLDYGTVKIYSGNYDQFCEKKELAIGQKELAIKKQEKRKDDLERFVVKFKAKASKARQAQSKAKMIERMEEIDLPRSSRRYPRFSFKTVRHSGVTPLKVEGISKSFGENHVLQNVGFEVQRGDRIALIGPNGIGKSTLLKILVEQLAPDAGQFEWGYEAHTAYFPQDHQEMVSGQSDLINWLWQFEPAATIGKIRNLLGLALFSGDDAEKKVKSLSGGESGRLILARLMLVPHNVLLLDEPTNHLDLEAIDQLAAALAGYDGTMVFVSHNRHFVSKIANRILAITEEGVRDYPGTYPEYLEQYGDDYLDRDVSLRVRDKKDKKNKTVGPAPSAGRSSLPADQRALKKRVAELESAVERLEAEKEQQNEVFLDWEAFNRLPLDEQKEHMAERDRLETTLAETMAAWEKAGQELEQC